MVAVITTPLYGTPVALTMTLASLASDASLLAGRQSTAVDVSSSTLVDALIGGKITTGTSPTAAKIIQIWCAGTYDGTTYTAGLGTSDANLTLTDPEKNQLRLLTVIDTDSTSNHTYEWGPISLAERFGGTMPPKFALFIVHNTTVVLHATGGNHEVKYTPVTTQSN